MFGREPRHIKILNEDVKHFDTSLNEERSKTELTLRAEDVKQFVTYIIAGRARQV
jgi:hypothetical protein